MVGIAWYKTGGKTVAVPRDDRPAVVGILWCKASGKIGIVLEEQEESSMEGHTRSQKEDKKKTSLLKTYTKPDGWGIKLKY